MKKSVFIFHNIIYLLLDQSHDNKGEDKYVCASRQFGIRLNDIKSKSELEKEYPEGKFLLGINVSDTLTFKDE